MRFFTFFIIIFFYYLSSFAANIGYDSNIFYLNKLNFCKITKEKSNNYEPENFVTTNNLLRKTGQYPIYCGEKIIVRGVVVDQNCVPISDAKIYIWQVNCKGKYPYNPLKNNIDKELIDLDTSLTFTGNGTATTNNKGEFHFVTIYPGAVHDMASHINIKVEHRKFGKLQTTLTLQGNKIKKTEYYRDFGAIGQIAKKGNISIYDYKIVLPVNSENSY